MTTNPLLSPTAAQESHPPPSDAKLTSLDDAIEHCIGHSGWKPLLQATLVSFAWFFDAQQAFISVFTDADPKWTCSNTNQSCTDICRLPAGAWTWNSPPNTSIISEWSLQCAASIIKGLPASSFFFGSLVGGFALAALADSSLGRKNMLVLSTLLMSLAGVATALSTGVWIYTALRFISGFGRATIGTCALVLSMELVGRKWREKIGIVGFIFFTLGFLSLPAIAYFSRDLSWRYIYLWTCVPSVLYSLSLLFLVGESPRWLFIKGRREEFAETLCLNQSFLEKFSNGKEKSEETDILSSLKYLFRKEWTWRRLLSIMMVAFGTGMIYYGMPLGLGNLSFNLYLSVTLNALSEFPASLFNFVLIGKMNRKGSVLGLSMLSGICSVICVVVRWPAMQMAVELVSFLSACTAVDIVLVYTVELFPTCMRNLAVAMVRQAVTLGGALSPVLVAVGGKNGVVSYGVFGVTICVCALFVVFLPETRGRSICDTVEEEERRLNGVYCV